MAICFRNKSGNVFEELVRQQQRGHDSCAWYRTSKLADGLTFLHKELTDTVASFEIMPWKGRSDGVSLTRYCFLSRSCTFYSYKDYKNKGDALSVTRTEGS